MLKWILCWGVLVCAAMPAHAAEPYVVTGVKVDVTAANAADARNQAMIQVQRNAFNALSAQILPQGPVPRVSDQALGDMVDDIRPEQENFTTNRYVASFTVRFRQIPVRSAFDGHEVPSPSELAAQQPSSAPPVAVANAIAAAPSANVPPVAGNSVPPPMADISPESPPSGPSKTMLVEIPAIMSTATPDAIRSAAGVTNLELSSQSPDHSIFLVTYQGDTYQMLQNLAARGVNLQVVAPTQPPVYTVMP